ncbi:GTP binding protein [Aureococcus anophagefferens]|nr:GTP binding protein [Aureococcus anophagefferens]
MSRALLLLLACSLVRIDGFVAPPRPAPTIQLYAEDGPSRRGRRRARKERTHLTTPTEAAAPAAPAPKKAIPRPSVLDGIGTPSPKKLKQRTAQPPEAAARARAPPARRQRRRRAPAPPAFEIYDSAPDERAADAPEPAAAEAPDDSPAAFAAAPLRGAVLEAAATNLDGAAALAARAPEEFAWADGENVFAARDGVDAALAAAFRDAAAEAYARDGPRPPRPSRGPRRRTGGNLRCSPASAATSAPRRVSGAWDRALVGETCAGAAPAETYDEHLNGAMVRSVDRGPTADAMARLPEPGPPEVVLLGRSNVGKSSLANALLGRRALAPTSPVPGRTRRFHFYDVNNGDGAESERPRFALVDVPGAGFAVSDVAAALEDGGLARPGVAEAAGGKQDSWRGADAAYAGDGGRAAVVRTAATARPPVGRADLAREIAAGLDAAS